ncbi:MAG TPA: LemA family protein, partial [Actinomycetales bacterium]
MTGGIIALLVLVAVVAAAVAVGVVLHGRLVALRTQVQQAWLLVDAELTRRHELVPRLVETVRAQAPHERAAL